MPEPATIVIHNDPADALATWTRLNKTGYFVIADETGVLHLCTGYGRLQNG